MRATPPDQLHPIFKGLRPFTIWVLDCITGLKPPLPEGYTDVLVIIDPFSKRVEAWPIKGPDLEGITRIFHWQIMCHFGKPSVVRTDGGPKFRGAFVDYTTLYGIRHRHISVYNARATGWVEHINGLLKSTMRMMADMPNGLPWYQSLPDILAGFRFLPSRTHRLTPFEALYKQKPQHPSEI